VCRASAPPTAAPRRAACALTERLDVQLLQQRRGAVADLVADREQLHARDHLDLALVDLGRDVERLEPGRLARVAARGARLDEDVDGREGADARGRGLGGLEDRLAHGGQVRVREDEAHVADEVLEDARDRVLVVLLEVVLDDLADRRVLAHEHDRVEGAQADADRLHLLRADVVAAHDEGRLVLLDVLAQLGAVLLLLLADRHLARG
jgi:hypothetical protein